MPNGVGRPPFGVSIFSSHSKLGARPSAFAERVLEKGTILTSFDTYRLSLLHRPEECAILSPALRGEVGSDL
jgi:hypothetical protein